MGAGAASGRVPSPGPVGGFGNAAGGGAPQPNVSEAEDQKKFSVARYSLNHSDLVDYLFVSATFSYKYYSPASFHFFVPNNERGFAVLERFSKDFLQRKLVHFDDARKQVVLNSSMLDMDYDEFLSSSEPKRQALFISFEKNL